MIIARLLVKIFDFFLVPATRCLLAFFRAFSMKQASDIGGFLGIMAGFMAFREMRGALRRIRKTLKLGLPEALTIYIRMCSSLGSLLAEFCHQDRINQRWVTKNLKPRGLEHLDNALKKGRGCIILTAHYGNWELIAATLARLGYPMNAVARPRHLHSLTRVIDIIRARSGTRIIYTGSSAPRQCMQALKRNELLGLVADEFPPSGGAVVDFLGRKTRAYRGPEALARKSGATILPVFCIRRSDGSLRLRILAPLKASKEKGDSVTDKSMRLYERVILSSPWQWTWFQRRWKDDH